MTDVIGIKILRACLADERNLERVISAGISSCHFLVRAMKDIFAFMATAYERDRIVSAEDFPGEYLPIVAEIVSTPWVQNLDHAIEEIKDRHWFAGLTTKAQDFLKSVERGGSKSEARNNFAGFASFVEADDRAPVEKCGADVHARSQQEIEDTYLAKRNGLAIGVPTGVPTLDKCLSGGFKPCELATIGALTGKGKTHIGVSLAMSAVRSGKKTCYVTIEMADTAIMKRMIANESGVNSKILTSGSFDAGKLDEQMDAVSKSSGPFMQRLLTIADETDGSIESLELLIRKLARQNKIDLLVIDYIQQFYFNKPLQNRVAELNLITSKVKHLTKRYKFSCVMLAQLNREAQKDKERGKAHSSHQFEQSHSMAKDSDIVLILDEDAIGGQEFLYLAKNRNGEDGLRIPVNLDRRTSRLTEAK